MRLFSPTVCLPVVLLLALPSNGEDRKPPAQGQESAGTDSEVVVMVARPEGPAQPWLASLIEAYVHFRLAANHGLALVDPDTLADRIPGYRRPGRPIPKSDYEKLYPSLGVMFVVWQNFELDEGDKQIQHYVELVRCEGNRLVAEIDTSFPAEEFGAYFDQVSLWVQENIGVKPHKHLKRFLTMPVLPDGAKDRRLLGEAIGKSIGATGEQAVTVAHELLELRQRNPRALLAQYYAGRCFRQADAYPRAAKQFREVLEIVPLYAPLYTQVARFMRLSNAYEEAVKYVEEAEEKNLVSTPLLIEKALSLEAMRKTERAARAHERVLTFDKNEPHALLFFAIRENEAGSREKALDFATRALAHGGDSGRAYLEQGISLAGLDKVDPAIDAFKKATARMPKNATPYEYLGDLYHAKGELQEAADYYVRARQVQPKRIEVSLKAARALETLGKREEALGVLKSIEHLARDSAVVPKRIGMLAYAIGDSATALRYLSQYAKMEEKDGEALVALGDLHTGRGEYQKAFYFYNHALPLLNDKKPCRMALARFYLRKKEAGAAIDLVKKVLAEDPQYAHAHRYLADAWLAAGNPRTALTHYRQAKEQAPGDLYVQDRVADLSYQLADKKTATEEYERLAALDSANAKAHTRLALLYIQQKDLKRGESFLAKATSLEKPDADMYYQLGTAFQKAGAPDRAAGMYREVLRVEPKRDDVWVKLAALQLETGKETDAAESHVKLFELNAKKYSDRLAQAGKLFEKNGLMKEARAAYERFLAGKFSDPEVNISLARMEYKAKKYERVVGLLAPLADNRAVDLEVLTMLGISYARIKRHEQAAATLARVIEKKRDDIQLLELAARSYQSAGNAARAIDMYSRLLETRRTDKHSEYAYSIGMLYESLNQTAKAIARYEENVNDYRKDIRNYKRLVALYTKARDHRRVTEILHAMERVPGAPPDLQKMLAESYAQMGDKANAARHYRRHLKGAPKDSAAWYALGTIYYEREDYKRALEPLHRAAGLMPANAACLLKAGLTHKHIGLRFGKKENVRSAIDYLSTVTTIDTTNAEAYAGLVECYRFENDTKALIGALKSLAALRPDDFDLQAELGSLLLVEGDLAGAAHAFEKASALRPADPSLHLTLADIYRKKGDQGKNLSHLQSALKLDPSDPDIHLALARHFAGNKKFNKAASHYKKSLSFRADNAAGHYEYAQVLVAQGKNGSALTALQAAVRYDPSDAGYVFELSKLAHELGKTTEALDYAGRARALHGDNAEILAWNGSLLMEAEHLDSARALLTEAISLDKKCITCYRHLANVYMREQMFAKAAQAYRDAEAAGGPADTLGLLQGKALLLERDYEGARRAFSEMIKKHAESDEARYWIVHTYVREGNIGKAEGELRDDRDQKSGWQYLAEAEVLESKGELQRAFVAYGVASRLLPDEGQPHAGLGRVSAEQKNYSGAIMYYGKAMANEPYNTEFVVDMGRAYEAIKEYSSAQAIYEEGLKHSPNNPEIYYLIANVLRRQRELHQAAAMAKRGLEKRPDYAELHYLLGDIERLSGRPREAIDAYEAALKAGGKEYHDAYRQIGLLYYHKLNDKSNAEKSFKRYIRAGGRDKEVEALIKKLVGR
ncbi:MAG: tetratricopeptide repeat protein [Chitinivibrionales bacterium]|nr:tetratricopeptide repeat protein [Chitinivibrionales bacterium]MBD3395339.1 tetratricopeptide repeat protein [Chitinivibrionales bacterium]